VYTPVNENIYMKIYSALDISKWFIIRFEDNYITHSKLQRLLYYSEAWTQVLLNRELFKEGLEAWSLGPSVQEVFTHYLEYKKIWHIEVLEILISRSILEVLEQVFTVYGEMSDDLLESMSQSDEPWVKARGELSHEQRCHNVISKDEIKEYFKKKYM
jgi:uncharacterized phage-associated protein